jgi:hypothetical protein
MSHEKTKRENQWLAAIATVLGVMLITAAPASARDEFGRGFENEMGRIVAHAAVGAGFGLFHAVAAPPVVVHHRPAPVVVHHERVYYDDHRPHYKHYKSKHHYRHVRHHRGHGDHRGHGHYRGEPYGYERRVVIERRGRYAGHRGGYGGYHD